MLERQALDRVHRLGQTKDVVSRCYVVQGLDSIELVSKHNVSLALKTVDSNRVV
jgi:hypothetical protein